MLGGLSIPCGLLRELFQRIHKLFNERVTQTKLYRVRSELFIRVNTFILSHKGLFKVFKSICENRVLGPIPPYRSNNYEKLFKMITLKWLHCREKQFITDVNAYCRQQNKTNHMGHLALRTMLIASSSNNIKREAIKQASPVPVPEDEIDSLVGALANISDYSQAESDHVDNDID